MNDSESTLPDLLVAQKTVYEPSGFVCKHFVSEAESKEYGACEFEMNHKRIKFRTGKITPTKIGQFVTLWKRIGTGPIQPFDMADPVDLFVVNVRSGDKLGQFVFPKTVLCEKGIVSKERKGGKRAMRIYPSWDNIPITPQDANFWLRLLHFRKTSSVRNRMDYFSPQKSS